MDLSAPEIRVLGCLLEKQRTTPDHYPLSLNSLRLACNQATNREPVVDYDDAIIRDALHRLGRRGYVRLAAASRAAKYRHLLSEALPMSSGEQAVMCVLMLRGPQTPGELKQRGERIHAFAGLDEVHSTLAALIERGLAAQLERRPGQKEDRYTQLLGAGESSNETAAVNEAPSMRVAPPLAAQEPDDLRDRVARLEREVAELRAAFAKLGDGGSVAGGHESGEESRPEDAHSVEPAWHEGTAPPAP
ncbi:MAG TPA: YceH family protein [Solirubrobacteraceae bacterium]